MEKQVCKGSQENTEKENLREHIAFADVKTYHKVIVL